MKTKLLLLFSIATLNSFAQSPPWLWAKSANENADDQAYSVAADALGNIYMAGSFQSSTILFGAVTLTNAGGGFEDAYLIKYDPNGNVLWAKGAGGNSIDRACSVIADASGNIYVTGFFYSHTITFGTITLINAGIFLVKYDTNGNVLWAKRAGGTGDYSESVTVDASGNAYIAGTSGSYTIAFDSITLTNSLPYMGNQYSDMFIVKYDSAGNVLWAKSVGGAQNEAAYSITADTSGIYVAGAFSSQTISFGSNTLSNDTTNGSSDIFIAKYDAVGNVLWAKSAGGTHKDYGSSVAADAFGNLYLSGSFQSQAITFGSTILTAAGCGNMFLAKYNASGNLLWAKSAGGTNDVRVNSNIVDTQGNCYVVGSFPCNSIIFGSITLTNDSIYFPCDIMATSDMFLVKYDPNGNVLWAKSVGGTLNDAASSVTIDASNNLYISGSFQSSSISFGIDTLVNGAGSNQCNMFLAKLPSDKYVWPGDVDNNRIVDNIDLLPIGLFYGHSGFSRDSINNLWLADSSANWGTMETNGYDIMHADCNGDGTIDINDTLAVNLNFSLTHSISQNNNNFNERTASGISFITSSSSYNPGDWVDAEVWLGNSSTPVNNLYGIAFNINYNSSLVQLNTESISYPASWLGTPGTNAIKITKTDALSNTAYGAITRINHTNASGFGKIADFKFRIKNTIPTTSTMHFSISNYTADNAAGVSQIFNKINDSITINAGSAGITEINVFSEIIISPNPFLSQTTISFTQEQKKTTIKIIDILGKEIKSINFTGKELIIEKGQMKAGIYFVQIIDADKNVVNKKIVVQ